MFIEVIGRRSLPDDVDRDDVEDLLTAVLGADGEVTGAGVGIGGWNLDVELAVDDGAATGVVSRLAVALVEQGLGWVELRPEGEGTGMPAQSLVE
ncbi:hypothetical protein ACPPVO_38685 [Dactylosporangium sp. McL0621]|uniref:hypothetical protein n=1 Tax=Dactylosporangium sp. McL0621 TaxID=3415678 RepID=UPI003CF1DC43